MIYIATLIICYGGVSYFYSQFFHFICCTDEISDEVRTIGTTNSREYLESERSSLINRNDEIYSIDDSEENNLTEAKQAENISVIDSINSREIVENDSMRDDKEDYLAENDIYSYPWIHKSRRIPTFRKQNCIAKIICDSFPDTSRPKTVRFNPLSLEHVTFDKEEYQRRNDKFFENLRIIRQNPAQLAQIYRKVNVLKAKMPKLETIYERHGDEVQEDFP